MLYLLSSLNGRRRPNGLPQLGSIDSYISDVKREYKAAEAFISTDSNSAETIYSNILMPSKNVASISEYILSGKANIRQALLDEEDTRMSTLSNVKSKYTLIDGLISRLENQLTGEALEDLHYLKDRFDAFTPLANSAISDINNNIIEPALEDLNNGELRVAEIEVDFAIEQLSNST